MGQYYRVLIEDKNGKRKVYNRDVDGKYTTAKLIGHSMWLNPFVNTICHEIHHNPMRIAWIGDYAKESEFHKMVWDEPDIAVGVTEAQVLLWEKYLVNHDKKVFLDCEKYYENSCREDNARWCLHPLPLLTCIGNGKGSGDYFSEHSINEIGTWYRDFISVENSKPEGYAEFEVVFREEG